MNSVESINGGYCEPPGRVEQAVEPKVVDDVPWWKSGPNAGLAAFGKEMCEELWESRGIRPPDGVGCWIVGRMCLAIDGASQNEAWARMNLIARHLREQEQGEVTEVTPVDGGDSKIDDANEYERVESTPKVFPFKRVSLDRIIPEPVDMVIWPFLPRGELTLMDGDPGVGKTWMWQALVAGLTGSRICPLPLDQEALSGFRALIVTTEDDLAKTIRPRLGALGADLSRIDVFVPTGKEEMFVTAANIDDAMASIQRNMPDMVIIDPVTLFISTEQNFDANKAAHVRKMFTRLVSEARRRKFALLVSRHFGKTPGKAIHRGIGSIDFSAMARSMLVVGPDPSDSAGKIRVVAHAKSNLVPQLNKGLLFSLDQNGNPPFQWLGLCDINPDHLTDSEAAFHAQDEKSKLTEAMNFLRQILAEGPVSITVCREQAKELGISESTLRRAREELGVTSEQSGFGQDKEWEWSLP